jgi:hypothetical protein
MALGSGFKRLFRIGDPTREIDEELEFHLAMKTEELVASGMTPEAARAEAVERLGDAGWIREECGTMRDVWIPLAMESAVNVRFPVWGDNFFDDILLVVARLAPGVDVAQAQAELDVLAAQIEEVDEEAGVRRRLRAGSTPWVPQHCHGRSGT